MDTKQKLKIVWTDEENHTPKNNLLSLPIWNTKISLTHKKIFEFHTLFLFPPLLSLLPAVHRLVRFSDRFFLNQTILLVKRNLLNKKVFVDLIWWSIFNISSRGIFSNNCPQQVLHTWLRRVITLRERERLIRGYMLKKKKTKCDGENLKKIQRETAKEALP